MQCRCSLMEAMRSSPISRSAAFEASGAVG
jgi:hypothetical protein